MKFDPTNTAIVVIDPQIDVLSPTGRNWAAVGASVTENDTVAHLAQLMETAVAQSYPLVISPHYFYPSDSQWLFNGPLESDEFATGTFARVGALDLTDFAGSGADWLPALAPFINRQTTVVASPHKVFGPQTNDVVLQLRKRGCDRVILAGMLANMCVESHLRHLLEDGFEVAVAVDAVAGPRHPAWGDGYRAALVNYRFLAHAVLPTGEIVSAMNGAA
ncbi:Nicotinamidase-related amidase [Mycolicibacterium rutilum]|uniref:Nicotinamidase-related amidase n=1 Tax=Mycolicibacterium rutilum TaxID=370526 RepID=A0A1H6KNI2_MYCRU|nr:isochorismatase family protein [Mycolicibacterium rutilum]SEH76987.1 Nicotinamidase-related amidase [Mycolicibacterium rutilum]